jgi:PLP dependent protein
MLLVDRIKEIQNRISQAAQSSGRDPQSVKLVAVTKTWPAENIRLAYQAGLRHFGENYVQEALPKLEELQALSDVHWHYIGALQSNKAKMVVNKFELIHSVDRLSLIQELDRRARAPQAILLEVQFVPEQSKSGADLLEVPELIEQVQKSQHLRLQGLMVMPPVEMQEQDRRQLFSDVAKKRREWSRLVSAPHNLHELSMGTSVDFELAIESGATLVRLGASIFGERKV